MIPCARLQTVCGLLLAVALGCGQPTAPSAPATDVRAPHVGALPRTPEDGAWATSPRFAAPLVLQDMVEPRKLVAGPTELQVQAVTDGTAIAFRLEWIDATEDSTRDAARFSDACAVQLPATISPDTPAPQMGETGRAVAITFWTAAAQATVDGRPEDIRVLHPNAKIDHYPFEAPGLEKKPAAQEDMAKQYAPAKAAGNPLASTPHKSVQDLMAEGPGSIRPAPPMDSAGLGRRTDRGWAVVISRPLPVGLAPGGRSIVAFAVWNGTEGDVGGRKMRTVWIPLVLAERSGS